MSAIQGAIYDNLLKLATTFQKARGLSLVTISKKAYGKSNFFADVRKNMKSKKTAQDLPGITITKLGEVHDWFDRNWPDGTPWPFLEPVTMARRNGASKK